MTDGFDPLEGLTQRQRLGLQELMAAVDQTHSWSWNMPVLIRQRCWLRLDCISLGQLQRWLPPDAREEAPELVYFRKLRADGMSEVEAEQTCWQEFGMDSCQQALHRYWDSRDESMSPWTSHHFLELVTLLPAFLRGGANPDPDAGAAQDRFGDRSSAALALDLTTADASHLPLIPGQGP